MRLKIPSFKRLGLLLFVVVPVIAWFVVKPVRVLWPKTQGVSCVSAQVCVEDPDTEATAVALYDEAHAFVSGAVMPIRGKPKMIFCSTDACAEKFGLGGRAALTIARFGIVIGPRAWRSFLVRHEMIHHVQFEQLGIVKMLRLPTWFVEGMAYSLSEDPRVPLPQPLEGYRAAFDAWYEGIDKQFVWYEARRLK